MWQMYSLQTVPDAVAEYCVLLEHVLRVPFAWLLERLFVLLEVGYPLGSQTSRRGYLRMDLCTY
jgi:hypothetical protein